jgi:hypothetical protein
MLARLTPFVALLAVATAQVTLPNMPGQRFVDFSDELASPNVIVALGTLGKWKEGKRERLEDGKLGGGAQVAAVSGTQYFKVPVTATLAARATLHGKAEDPKVAFDIQVARLPDGKEKRQTLAGAALEEDQLALFVIAPRAKKGHELRHVIAFDAADGNGQEAFADNARDYYTVNRRMHDLKQAMAELERAKDAAVRQTARKALEDLLAQKPELKRVQNDGLLAMHVAPLEQRAKKRVAESASEPAK